MIDRLWHTRKLAFGARAAFDTDERELFWHLANKIQPSLYQVKGPSRPLPVVEDMAVPPESLPRFLVKMQNVFKRYQVTASLFSHAGQGQLHVQPFIDLDREDDVRRPPRRSGDPPPRARGCRAIETTQHTTPPKPVSSGRLSLH